MTREILLREVSDDDLPVFFAQQLDADAAYIAAFTARNPADREAFAAHWATIRGDDTVAIRTILVDGQVAGHVLRFDEAGRREVSYWLGKDYWGRGIATRALSAFLGQYQARPLYARAAKDNVDLSAVGALLADPARTAILAALLGGVAVPAGELAQVAGVTPSTASIHLARLLEVGWVAVERRGRHRYYRLASARVATVLEQIARVAPPVPVRSLRNCHYGARSGPWRRHTRPASTC